MARLRNSFQKRNSRRDCRIARQFKWLSAGFRPIRIRPRPRITKFSQVRYNECICLFCRGVAQPGSAPALGAGGRRFKSSRPDQSMSYGFFLYSKQRFDPMSGFEKFLQERIYLQNVSPRTIDWYKQTFKMVGKISSD